MLKLFNLVSEKIIKVCFMVFGIIFAISNIFFTTYVNRGTYNEEFNFVSLINILIVLVLLIVLYILLKKDFFKISDKKLLISFLVFSFIIGSIWILINDSELKSLDDSYNCFHAALNIVSGNYNSLSYKSYLSVYPNNAGFITYLVFMFKLFKGNLYVIRFINLIFVLIGYASLYGICKLLFKDRLINCILIYLLYGSMQFVFYSFIVYGNCISYSLGLLSVYFLLRFFDSNRIYNLLISVISIVVSIIIKNNSLIILVAEIIYLFIYFLNNKKLVVLLCAVLMVTGSILGTSGLQKYWGNKVGIDYNDTKLPTLCWLAYGVNYNKDKPGSYTSQFENYHAENDYVSKYTKIEAKRFIDSSLEAFKDNPLLALRFYGQKILACFSNPMYDCFDYYEDLDKSSFVSDVVSGDINNILTNLYDGISSIIGFGLLLFIFKQYRNISIYQTIGMCIVFGGFLFHMFWEVKAIYLYQYFMYLIPYSAYGLKYLYNFKDEKII